MCLPFQWFFDSLNYTIIPILSQYRFVGSTAKGTTSSVIRNFLSQKAPFAASKVATYSASIVESTIQRLLHTSPTNSPPPRVNTNPKIDLRESLSDQKFKFVYPRCIKYRLYRFSHFWFFMFYCVLVVSIYSWCIGNMPPFFKMLFMYITILNSIFVHLQRNKEELYE